MKHPPLKSAGIFEAAPGFMDGLSELPKHLNVSTVTTGIVAAIFGCTGPVLIITNAAIEAGYSPHQISSWIFAIYFFGGILSLVMALRYKQPITGAWSMTAAVMVGTVLPGITINEAAGAYFLSGMMVMLFGVTGFIGKLMMWIPLPIVMGMISGAMIRFGTGIVFAVESMPAVGFAALLGFLLCARISTKMPSILGALALGGIAAAFAGSMDFASSSYTLQAPNLVMPHFSLDGFLSISVPLSILIIGAENAQAIGILSAQGYRPPVNFMTAVSGLGGMAASLFGGHTANVAGPMTAICSSPEAGEFDGRYAATVVDGIIFCIFGMFSGVAVGLISGLPVDLVNVVAGLSMVGVLIQSYEHAFAEKKYRTGAFFAMIIAMSNVSAAGISAPFWALIGGVAVSMVVGVKEGKAGR